MVVGKKMQRKGVKLLNGSNSPNIGCTACLAGFSVVFQNYNSHTLIQNFQIGRESV
ncbi:hypothetical protein ZOSMA_98G00200 [Zostera marina]|uniref:Uncharacterized protein n=1 Tax=Zostera marina TaxID=29655 RepID=A0A0K9NHG0_ZOSMR|nr:hypothetical protein ZOSMA_98G00200 [Zostera marina]